MNSPVSSLSLAIPAYFHPAVAPNDWSRLTELAPVIRFVIVNVHNGPGEALDPLYVPAVKALQAAGVRAVGYVDTDYGRREPADIGREVSAYRERYEISGVFMDQVSNGLDQLDHYAQCVAAARTAGAPFVVLNAGTEPHRGYVDLANVTVTFEGPWSEYEALRTPDWVHRYPASRFCHLVHSLPRDRFAEGLELAAQRHVGGIFLTDGLGSNPWDRVPPLLVDELEASRNNDQSVA